MVNIINDLNEIMGSNLQEDDITKKVEDVFQWDSFNIMNLLVGIQDKYEITLDILQISNIETVQDIITLIEGGK